MPRKRKRSGQLVYKFPSSRTKPGKKLRQGAATADWRLGNVKTVTLGGAKTNRATPRAPFSRQKAKNTSGRAFNRLHPRASNGKFRKK